MSVVKNSDNCGFSLIELLAVIILLGILGVYALGRLSGPDGFAARGFFDDTVTAVRFAQKLAISSGCDVRVILNNDSYELRQSSSCTADDFTVPVVNPADRGRLYENNNIPDGFTLTAGTITFDARGIREGPTSTFTFSDGSTSYQFTVNASTGLVQN